MYRDGLVSAAYKLARKFQAQKRARLLLVDMDGILCAYNEKLIDLGLIKREQFTSEKWRDCSIDAEQKERIRLTVSSPGFFANLDPMPGAIEGVAGLLESNWDVYACSRPGISEHAWRDKYAWIRRCCPSLIQRTILTSTKSIIKADVFIDDSLDDLMSWNGKLKILLQTNCAISYRFVPHGIKHFSSWSGVLRSPLIGALARSKVQ